MKYPKTNKPTVSSNFRSKDKTKKAYTAGQTLNKIAITFLDWRYTPQYTAPKKDKITVE